MKNLKRDWVTPELSNLGSMIEITKLSESGLNQIVDLISRNDLSLLASMVGF